MTGYATDCVLLMEETKTRGPNFVVAYHTCCQPLWQGDPVAGVVVYYSTLLYFFVLLKLLPSPSFVDSSASVVVRLRSASEVQEGICPVRPPGMIVLDSVTLV